MKDTTKNYLKGVNQKINDLVSKPFFRVFISYINKNNIKAYIYREFVRSFYTHENVKTIRIAIMSDAIKAAEYIHRTLKINYTCIHNTFTFFIDSLIYNGIEKIILTDNIKTDKYHSYHLKNMSIETFLAYTDFNINALALSLHYEDNANIIKIEEAKNDIKDRIISTTISPRIAFEERPLLILESFILSSEINYDISKRCCDALSSVLEIDLNEENNEEVHDTILRLLTSPKLSSIIQSMKQKGILDKFLPELFSITTHKTAGYISNTNDLTYTLEVLEEVCKKTDNLVIRLTTLFMFIGNSELNNFVPLKGWISLDYETEDLLSLVFKRLKIQDNSRITQVRKLLSIIKKLHLIKLETLSDIDIRNIISDASENLEDLILLYECCKKVDGKISDYILFNERINKCKCTSTTTTSSRQKNYRIMNDSTCLALFSDGTYLLKDIKETDVISNAMMVSSEQTVLLQCYDNGYVNKVYLEDIWKLKREFIYKKAIYPHACMLSLFLTSDRDILHVHDLNDLGNNTYSIPISSIKEHSMLGLKGSLIIKNKGICSWNISKKKD